jgi:crotonobetainyl-CoA:carnitine CoA-transferase CaiB-like acyl-CoA transferase
VLAALHERDRTGRGGVVEASLMESMLTLMSYQAQKYLSLGVVPGQDGNDHPIMFPQGTFPTGAGAITLACGDERMWRRLCSALGLDGLVDDPRFRDNALRMANRGELRALLEKRLAERSAEQWLESIGAAGVPCGPVLDLGQALTHPVTAGLRMVEEVTHASLGPMKVLGQAVKVNDSEDRWLKAPPPLLGQQTREVLSEIGYAKAEVDALLASGVARQADPP